VGPSWNRRGRLAARLRRRYGSCRDHPLHVRAFSAAFFHLAEAVKKAVPFGDRRGPIRTR